MTPKTKMRIRLAVADYQKIFSEDYEAFLAHMTQRREGLNDDFATLEGASNLKRHLTEIPEKLSTMIGIKLSDVERIAFKELENMRWFASEFPQFTLTKEV